ncbi:MAG: efflux RND transporter permease subunit, partial [Betaproteobacteria bacterium]|nr:efflux RND transporter permease subunit [Betaproteobacteria bacterium]
FQSMKVQNFPDLDLPTIQVQVALPGATPNQLETDVARKLENAIAPLQGLKHISTKISDGAVSITAEFRLEKPVQEALDEVRSAVQTSRTDLPADLREPVISKLNLAGTPVLAYTIASSTLDEEALSWFVDKELSKRLLAIRGVGAVQRVGGVNREISVQLDPIRMNAIGMSAAEVSRQLRAVQQEASGGRTDLAKAQQPVRLLASLAEAQSLNKFAIALPQGGSIRLDQLADIRDGIAERRSAAFLNGQAVVGFEVVRSRGESEVQVGQRVRESLRQLKAERADIQLTEAFDFVTPVEEEYDGSLMLLYEGALLAVLVVWVFLRDWRATFVSALALPLSVIPAFAGMAWLGFSVNVVTLLALSLVIGVLVDDAIVEVENIVRHLRMGKSPIQAAIDAEFFKQFGWTASLAVFASLLVARMLTPMMAAYMLHDKGTAHHEPFWMKPYLRLVKLCLRFRWLSLLLAIGFFLGSLSLIPLLPTGFIPPDDNSQTQVYLELPPGSSLEQSTKTAEAARQLLSSIKEIQSVYTTIGAGTAGTDPFLGGGANEPRKATLTIALTPRGDRARKQVIEASIREALKSLPGVRSKVGLGGSGEKYILVLTGDDPQSLSQAAIDVERDLRSIKGLGSIASSASLSRPEVMIRPDVAKAADLGVTTAAMAQTLRIATLGDYDAALAKLNLSDRQVPIVVRLKDDARQDMQTLGQLLIPGSKGPVMLSQVASIELGGGPALIERYDRERNINFEIELSGMPLGDVTAAVAQLPSLKQLPPGVAQREIGDAEVMGELFASFALAMGIGILCITMVLILLFKSVLHPITILAALPLSLGGAFVALLLADKSFSMPSLIGLIMLMGIATKNSILLVEYAIEASKTGLDRHQALIEACRLRARPIIMTTIAMGAGMLPIASGWGAADASFRSPMAIAVIGGLLTSTVLSLLVIPVVYTFIDDLDRFFGGLRKMPKVKLAK